MKVAILGVGLIGGSLALNFKKHFEECRVYGQASRESSLDRAKELGIIDEKYYERDYTDFDYVVLATSVEHIKEILPDVLDAVGDNTIVFDAGSTKESICKGVENHPKRGNFIAAHPIAGTEFSGPNSAFKTLFNDKLCILCDIDKSDNDKVEQLEQTLKMFKMILQYMSSSSHDKHAAYVSHLSHVSSFMLGKTVIEIEKDEQRIFDMAGSGFESTVRLAKSSPQTWTAIFKENKEHLRNALKEYIANLTKFENLLSSDNFEKIKEELNNTNKIKNILS